MEMLCLYIWFMQYKKILIIVIYVNLQTYWCEPYWTSNPWPFLGTIIGLSATIDYFRPWHQAKGVLWLSRPTHKAKCKKVLLICFFVLWILALLLRIIKRSKPYLWGYNKYIGPTRGVCHEIWTLPVGLTRVYKYFTLNLWTLNIGPFKH